MNTIGQLIREARGSASQKEFAAELGTNQSMLSKYEKGAVSRIPSGIVEECMRLVNISRANTIPDAETVARRVLSELGGEDRLEARRAILQILDCLGGASADPPSAGPAAKKRVGRGKGTGARLRK